MPTSTQIDASRIAPGTSLVDMDGKHAEVLSIEHGSPHPFATLRTEHGRIVRVSSDMMRRLEDGTCQLVFSLAQLADEPSADPRDREDGREALAGEGFSETVIPVVEERLQVDRRTIDTGAGVRVTKTVSQREEVVDVPLEHDELEVVRVPVDRTLAAGEQAIARHEGDTLIVPVLEEILVVEKRWRLKEEVRITRHRREAHAAHRVVLRSEEVTAERFNENESGFPKSGS